MSISTIIDRLVDIDKEIINEIGNLVSPDPDLSRAEFWKVSQTIREAMFLLADIGRSQTPKKNPVK